MPRSPEPHWINKFFAALARIEGIVSFFIGSIGCGVLAFYLLAARLEAVVLEPVMMFSSLVGGVLAVLGVRFLIDSLRG